MPDTASFPDFKIPPDKLRWSCDPGSLPFQSTDELKPLRGLLGQERAQKALTLGTEMSGPGYNIFVCGLTGTGRLTAVRQILEARQQQGKVAPDLCYVSRFRHADQPRLLRLPPGQGRRLQQAMEEALSDLKRDIPRALASEEVQQRIRARFQAARRREEQLLKQIESQLEPDFGLLWTHTHAGHEPELAPRLDGELVPLMELDARLEAGELPLEGYRHLHAQHRLLLTECGPIFTDIRRLHREAEADAQVLERAHIRPLIQKRLQAAAAPFADEAIQDYFREAAHALTEDSGRLCLPPAAEKEGGHEEEVLHKYQVNLFVDNAEAAGPPVIFETAPTYKNLFGSIDPIPEHGGIWRSDFASIRAGSLHRANGGYLVFDAQDAFADPMVWPVLKRVLRYGQADIQPQDHPGAMPGTMLKPDAVSCEVKVIVLGDGELYDALAREDENFTRLFKVKADFDTILPRHEDSIARYADFLRRICHEEHLRACDREAVAAIVECGVRLAGRQNKISARLEVIADVLREADYWAGKAYSSLITRAAVEQALLEQEARLNLSEAELHEFIDEGILLLTTQGGVVGQVNGLVVYETATDYSFGIPVRLTATTTMGNTGVVNIEREANLSDATYHKGVLILSGYLNHAFGYDKPVMLNASLCVEQSYQGIAGDSASVAEVIAVLSSLAGLPVDQGIAVTGSVNQKGELQPVSGVNEKIEGFFEVCRRQGLTGTQGVILPVQNVADLMLRQPVIDAVAAGQFHLYAIRAIDDALPILMGLPAGTWEPERGYPPESVNGRVDDQLRRFVHQWYRLHSGAASGDAPALSVPYPL
jgi:predicted ATP-dependent protease